MKAQVWKKFLTAAHLQALGIDEVYYFLEGADPNNFDTLNHLDRVVFLDKGKTEVKHYGIRDLKAKFESYQKAGISVRVSSLGSRR